MDLQGLHEQLNNIQSQLQNAMSTQSFVQPAPIQQGTQPFGFVDATANFSQNLGNQVSQSFVAMNETTNSVSAQIQQLSASMQMGAYKANEFSMLNQITTPMTQALLPRTSIDSGQKASFDDAGMFRSFFGQLGMFYDPNESRMSRTEYQTLARERWNSAEMQTEITGGLLGLGADAIGAAIGTSIMPGVGTVVGAGIGLLAGEVVGGLYGFSQGLNIENERIANYVKEGSFRFAGGSFSRAQAGDIASHIQNIGQSYESYSRGFRPMQVEGMIAEFTEGGGFDYVRTAEEYKQKVDQLMETSQKVSHILHSSIKGAVDTMAQMEQAGITSSPIESLNLLSRLDGRAGIAGMTTGEMLNSAFMGASMVQGTGVNLLTGAMGLTDMNVLVGQAMNMGFLGADTMAHVGGRDKAAQLLFSNAMSYGTSPIAVGLNAAGGGIQYDMLSAMAQGAGNMTSRESILGVLGSQDQYIESMGIQGLLGQKLSQAAFMSDLYGLKPKTAEEMRGFLLSTNMASSLAEADLLMGAGAAMADGPGRAIGAQLEAETAAANIEPGRITKIVNGAAWAFDTTLNLFKSRDPKQYVNLEQLEIKKAESYTVSEEDKRFYDRFYHRGAPKNPKDIENDIKFWVNAGGYDVTWNMDEKMEAAHALGYSSYVEMMVNLEKMSPAERDNVLRRTGKVDEKLLSDMENDFDERGVKNAMSIYKVTQSNASSTRLSSQLKKDFETLPGEFVFSSNYDSNNKEYREFRKEAADVGEAKTPEEAKKELMELRALYRSSKNQAGLKDAFPDLFENDGYADILKAQTDAIAVNRVDTMIDALAYGKGPLGAVSSTNAMQGSTELTALLGRHEVRQFLELLQRLIQSMNENERLKIQQNYANAYGN